MMANKKGKDKPIWTIRMEVNDPISKTDNRSIELTLLYINILKRIKYQRNFLMYRNIYTQNGILMVLFEVKVLLRRNETSKLTATKHLL